MENSDKISKSIRIWGALIASPLFFIASTVASPFVGHIFCFTAGALLGRAIVIAARLQD